MELISENKYVKLYQKDEEIYDIYTDTKVGEIILKQDQNQNTVSIYIEPTYRNQHYSTNALYLFSNYVHHTLKINIIHAIVPVENDQIRHTVEHSGFYIVSRDDHYIYYSHRDFKSRKDTCEKLAAPLKRIYFAGGCFWGMERVFKILNGVVNTTTGYVNGTLENPSYADVIRNDTGYKECVRVIYDSSLISLETLLKAYFMTIHPEQKEGQANDIGEQYTTGVYYTDKNDLALLADYFNEEKKKHAAFYVELKPLECFYEAEDYHQDYLTKNPNGYCHITNIDLEKVKQLNKQEK